MRFDRVGLALASLLFAAACASQNCPSGSTSSHGQCAATGGIAGTVTFADRSPSSGISVALLGTDHVATTDDSGAFAFTSVDPGARELEASAAGYASLRLKVTVQAGAIAMATGTLIPLGAAPDGGMDSGMSDGGSEGGAGGPGTINGTALLFEQADNSGITVTLTGGGSAASRSTTTRQNGSYSFAGVAAGAYSLSFSAPLFETTQIGNVLSAPGVVTVPPVTLERSHQLDPRTLVAGEFLENSSKAIVVVKDPHGGLNPLVYDSANDALTPFNGGTLILAEDAADDFATLEVANGGLQRWTVATDAIDPINPPTNSPIPPAGRTNGPTYFISKTQDLYQVTPGSTQGTLVLPLPCAGGSMFYDTPLYGQPPSPEYFSVTVTCPNVTQTAHVYVHRASGKFTGWVLEADQPPNSANLFTIEYDAFPPTASTTVSLHKYDLSSWNATMLAQNVAVASNRFFGYNEPLDFFHDVDPVTHRGTLAILDRTTGVEHDLATDLAQQLDVEALPGLIVGRQGSQGDVLAIRPDKLSATKVCSGPAVLAVQQPFFGPEPQGTRSNPPYVACGTAGGSSVGIYDYTSDTMRTVTGTVPSSGNRFAQQGEFLLMGNYAVLPSDPTADSVQLCQTGKPGYINEGGTDSAIVYSCVVNYAAQSLEFANLRAGTTQNLFSSLGIMGLVNLGFSCSIGPSGSAAICQTHTDASGPQLCAAQDCLVAFGSNGAETVVKATPYVYSGGGVPQVAWAADDSGAAGETQHSDSAFFRWDGSALFLAQAPGDYDGVAVGPGGRYSIVRAHQTAAPYLHDDVLNTLTMLPGNGYVAAIAGGSDCLASDAVYNLTDGSHKSLGSGVTGVEISDDGTIISFLQGSPKELDRYSTADGESTLATNVDYYDPAEMGGFSTATLFWANSTATTGRLISLDRQHGQVTGVGTNLSRQLTPIAQSSVKYFGLDHADTTGMTGTLSIVNVNPISITSLGARTTLPLSPTIGTTRIALNGEDDQGNPGSYVAQLDGSGAHRLAGPAENFAFLPDDVRVTFSIQDTWWIEGAGAIPAVPVAHWSDGPQLAFMSPDGRVLIFGLTGAAGYAHPRSGVYRALLK